MLERRKFKAVHSENPEREVNSLLKTAAHIRASVGASARVATSCAPACRPPIEAEAHRGSGLMAGPHHELSHPARKQFNGLGGVDPPGVFVA
jgi:hypothetical protein